MFRTVPLLLLFALVPSCMQSSSSKSEPKGSGSPVEEAVELGPHQGVIVEWGDEEYHVEVLLDAGQREMRIYILGPDAATLAPIQVNRMLITLHHPHMQLVLQPAPASREPPGCASSFVGKHPRFDGKKTVTGIVSAVVEGKPYAGDFKVAASSEGRGAKD